MSHKDDDMLASVRLFSTLSAKERSEVRSLMTEVEVEAGRVLAHQGAHGQEFFVILEGRAKVERDGDQIAEVGPGDFQGEISLLDGGPRTATVTAITPMKILVASHPEFDALLDRVPMIGRRMLPVLAKRIRQIAEHDHTH
jgi:CRP/FNR family transcriptional regulator, cyclic AMP receptor protein